MTIPPNTPGWVLPNIRSKFRSVTGMQGAEQMSDAQVDAYLQNYIMYVMPHELKVQIQNQNLIFKTIPGVNTYSFPSAFLTDSPGAYADGFPLIFYEDPDIFYQDWPMQYVVETIGGGGTASYTGTLQNPPVIVGTLFMTDGAQVANDSITTFPNGTFTGNVTGTNTIDYLTGAYTLQFATAAPATATVYAKYQSYQANRPQGVLFFNNQFTLMPVPDQVYQIQMQGFIAPVALSETDSPVQMEWGPLIAYGGALEAFADRGDMENYNRYMPVLKRYESIAMDRTIQQYTPMQGVPRF